MLVTLALSILAADGWITFTAHMYGLTVHTYRYNLISSLSGSNEKETE